MKIVFIRIRIRVRIVFVSDTETGARPPFVWNFQTEWKMNLTDDDVRLPLPPPPVRTCAECAVINSTGTGCLAGFLRAPPSERPPAPAIVLPRSRCGRFIGAFPRPANFTVHVFFDPDIIGWKSVGRPEPRRAADRGVPSTNRWRIPRRREPRLSTPPPPHPSPLHTLNIGPLYSIFSSELYNLWFRIRICYCVNENKT